MHCITIYVSIGQSNLSEAASQQTWFTDTDDFIGVVSQMQPEDFFAFVDTYITYSFVSCPSPSQVEGFFMQETLSDDFRKFLSQRVLTTLIPYTIILMYWEGEVALQQLSFKSF